MRCTLIAMLIAISGCAAESHAPPVSTTAPFGLGPSPDNKAPESPNALPRGSAVDSPFVPSYGTINQTPARSY